MKYEVILEKGEYALILRGSRMEEYAVVNGLNKETGEWCWTCCYYNFGNYTQIDKAQALFLALDYFRMRTETNYILFCFSCHNYSSSSPYCSFKHSSLQAIIGNPDQA